MTENSKATNSLEIKLQPWIDQAEYIIILTIIIMTWAGGWVNLLAFESFNPVILGRYSIFVFSIIVAYSMGFILWFWLVISLDALSGLKKVIAFFQNNWLFFIPVLLVMAGIVWTMTYIGWWAIFPLIQVNLLVIFISFILLVLLAKPTETTPFHLWRKVGLAIIILLFVAESILQGLAYFKLLPFDTVTGLTVPYGRVYQSEQGFTDGQTNRYGWYYPEFRLEEGSKRILLSGDTYLIGFQIPKEENMGQHLEAQLQDKSVDDNPEVMVQGQMGYGAEMYLNTLLYSYIWRDLDVDEMVVFINLGSDFMTDISEDARPPLVANSRGTLYVRSSDFSTWHKDAHVNLAGHDAINPLRTVYSNSLLITWLNQILFDRGATDILLPLATDASTADAPFGTATFLFDPAGNERSDLAQEYMQAQLEVLNDYMTELGIKLRIVTVPYFPSSFYETYSGSDWETAIGDYDLLLPEQVIQDTATNNDIPFLSIGQWMQSQDTTVDTIQSLFFNEGTGYLTVTGHQYMADAIFSCFYDDAAYEIDSGCINN